MLTGEQQCNKVVVVRCEGPSLQSHILERTPSSFSGAQLCVFSDLRVFSIISNILVITVIVPLLTPSTSALLAVSETNCEPSLIMEMIISNIDLESPVDSLGHRALPEQI